jgi:crotonobetainyl-CoA:carnitine CoA-transferase CaiB-like acyl-CoA transferase
MAEQSAGFLHGLKVLDLTDHRGIMAGRMLGLMGADVLQIESAVGTDSRRLAPFDDAGNSLFWASYGTGRTSLVLDRLADRDRLAALLDQADIVLESGRPGTDTFLDTDAMLARNPALIHVIVTPFGLDGPKAGYADSDLVVWAAGGPLGPTESQAGGVPTRISLPQAFHHAAADAVCGAMVALESRRRSGIGQRVVTSAQASATQSTLSLSLAAIIGHDGYVFRKEIRSKKKAQLDLSGSGSRTQRSKWPVRDGLVEMHLAIGPAAGRFTNALFKLMHARGACSAEFADWDWVTLPPLIENDVISEESLERARQDVAEFLAGMTKREAIEMALEHRLMLAPIMTLADLLDSPHATARGFFQKVGDLQLPGVFAQGFDDGFTTPCAAPALGNGGEASEQNWHGQTATPRPFAPALATKPPVAPFEGLTVLDLSWVVAGPMIGRCLADFGARVIRVESRKKPETARLTGPYPDGLRDLDKSGLYENCNASKLGLTLDLGTEEGRGVLRDLLHKADVLVESFAPGQMARWGMGYDDLAAENPGLVMLSTALMGQSGPWHKLAGFGNIGAAMSGIQQLAGRPDQPPAGPYGPYTDFVAPRLALPTLIGALEKRRQTGRGCWLDVSQAEAGMHFIAEGFADFQRNGQLPEPVGNHDPLIIPNNVYKCRAPEGETRWVAISAPSDRDWQALAAATERSDLAKDGLATLAGRAAAQGQIDAALSEWCATQDAEQIETFLQAKGVPAYVVASTHDLAQDAQLAEWGHFVRVPRSDGSVSIVEACRFDLSETPAITQLSAPDYGRDTEAILNDVLGYSSDQIDALHLSGALN